jgi:hypothetical protein
MPSPLRGRADGSTPAAQPQPEGREGPQARSGVEAADRPRSQRTSEPSACRPRTSHGYTPGAPAMWRTRRTMDCASAGATAVRTQAASLALRFAMPGRPAGRAPTISPQRGRQQRPGATRLAEIVMDVAKPQRRALGRRVGRLAASALGIAKGNALGSGPGGRLAHRWGGRSPRDR